MKITDLYKWGLPNRNAWAESYGNLHDQANALWNSFDGFAVWFLVIFLALALTVCAFYYWTYNEMPGRHYKIKHWAIWLGLAALSSAVLSFVIGALAVSPSMGTSFGRLDLLLRISLMNALYAAGVYFLLSVLVCNVRPIKTNAYKFLQIGK